MVGVFALTGALAFGVVSAALFINKQGGLAKAAEHTDYRQTLTFTAENMTSGSGSVTLNGNTFNYTNVVVSGGNLTFGAGSSLVFAGESGESISGDGMVGGSFKEISFTSVGNCEFTYTFNGVSGLEAEALDGETVTNQINTTQFNIAVTAGSFTTPAFNVKYDCVAPVESQRVLLIGDDSYMGNSNYKASQAYTSLMTSLGGSVTVDELITNSSRPNYTMAVLAKTSTNFYKAMNNLLNANEYDAIVLQVCTRVTPSATDVEACEIAAITSLRDRLHQETDNIYIFATQDADGNPTIYQNNDNLKYTETENHEEKTFEEMCAYYSSLAETMATAVNGKAMHFSDCYSYYKSASGLKYSINYPSLRYMYAHVMYATFFDRVVPSAATYQGENGEGTGAASEKARAGVELVVSMYCIS